MTGPRPNILLITADQWRGDSLGIAAHPLVQTPNVDRLAARGACFRNHFAAAAPCSPARASLYTGLYQMHTRVVRNGSPLDARFDNLALAARRASYDPTLFGYTDTAPDPRGRDPNDPDLASYEGILPGFCVRQALCEDDATWLTWLAKEQGAPRATQDIHAPPPEDGERVSRRAPAYDAGQTQTAFLTNAFVDWLAEQTAPWFAHISFLRPHPPFVVPEPYASLYDADAGPSFLQAEGPEHPLVRALRGNKGLSHFLQGQSGHIADLEERDLRRVRALYWGMITEVDAQIGRLTDALGPDTLVILTSDHGEMMGDYGLLGKGGFYPQSYHIPLVIAGPGVAPGTTVTAFTSAVDIFPTLLEIMGVSAGHAPDGNTLVPFLAGQKPSGWRQAALWEFDFRDLAAGAAECLADYDPSDARLMALCDQAGAYIHMPGREGFTIGHTDLGPADLLSETMRLHDETLAARAVWEWKTG